jgi:Restriction endonuclease
LLSDAVAAFLSSVSERAFDQALLAVLRAHGFERVHLVHGQREFGKDIIGQRDEEQWPGNRRPETSAIPIGGT